MESVDEFKDANEGYAGQKQETESEIQTEHISRPDVGDLKNRRRVIITDVSLASMNKQRLSIMISRAHALQLLSLCDGEEIWSIDYCRRQSVPERWVRELRNAYESGFVNPTQTIYYEGRIVNQFEGVLAVDIAIRIAEVLGVNVASIASCHLSREEIVRAIREQIEEG